MGPLLQQLFLLSLLFLGLLLQSGFLANPLQRNVRLCGIVFSLWHLLTLVEGPEGLPPLVHLAVRVLLIGLLLIFSLLLQRTTLPQKKIRLTFYVVLILTFFLLPALALLWFFQMNIRIWEYSAVMTGLWWTFAPFWKLNIPPAATAVPPPTTEDIEESGQPLVWEGEAI